MEKDDTNVYAELESWCAGVVVESDLRKSCTLSPTRDERRAIQAVILDFVLAKSRVIYGGYALHSSGMKLYEDDDIPDIEFYSPDPVSDIVDICDVLHGTWEFVQGREAVHPTTFTVSVEFVRMCDVSYLPPDVFASIPFTELDSGLRVVDPKFATIDLLRIACDYTSHWRLPKALPRLASVLKTRWSSPSSDREVTRALPKRFLLRGLAGENVADVMNVDYQKSDANITSEVFDDVISFSTSHRDSCALVGCEAIYRIFSDVAKKDVSSESASACGRHVSMVSTSYDNDRKDFLELVAFRGRVSEVDHDPFCDLIGRRTIFFMDDVPVATLIDAGRIAVPVLADTPSSEPRVATVPFIFLYSLTFEFMAKTHGNLKDEEYFRDLTCFLLPAISAKDAIASEYIGTPISTMRAHMMYTDARRSAFGTSATMWLSYDPRQLKKELQNRDLKNKRSLQGPKTTKTSVKVKGDGEVSEETKHINYPFLSMSGRVISQKKSQQF